MSDFNLKLSDVPLVSLKGKRVLDVTVCVFTEEVLGILDIDRSSAKELGFAFDVCIGVFFVGGDVGENVDFLDLRKVFLLERNREGVVFEGGIGKVSGHFGSDLFGERRDFNHDEVVEVLLEAKIAHCYLDRGSKVLHWLLDSPVRLLRSFFLVYVSGNTLGLALFLRSRLCFLVLFQLGLWIRFI